MGGRSRRAAAGPGIGWDHASQSRGGLRLRFPCGCRCAGCGAGSARDPDKTRQCRAGLRHPGPPDGLPAGAQRRAQSALRRHRHGVHAAGGAARHPLGFRLLPDDRRDRGAELLARNARRRCEARAAQLRGPRRHRQRRARRKLQGHGDRGARPPRAYPALRRTPRRQPRRRAHAQGAPVGRPHLLAEGLQPAAHVRRPCDAVGPGQQALRPHGPGRRRALPRRRVPRGPIRVPSWCRRRATS